MSKDSEKTADQWCDEGNLLGGKGQYEEALKCLDKALELDPEHALSWFNKGLTLMNMRRKPCSKFFGLNFFPIKLFCLFPQTRIHQPSFKLLPLRPRWQAFKAKPPLMSARITPASSQQLILIQCSSSSKSNLFKKMKS